MNSKQIYNADHSTKEFDPTEEELIQQNAKRQVWCQRHFAITGRRIDPTVFNKLEEKIKLHSNEINPRNNTITAGFTYFGQFVAHDISYMRKFAGSKNPQLQLNSLYGGGPELSSYLYNQSAADLGCQTNAYIDVALENFHKVLFKLSRKSLYLYEPIRTVQGVALVADSRNDQNFILSQLHVAWLRFHNKVALYSHQLKSVIKTQALFQKVRETVVQHYQWIIVHQYLKQLTYTSDLVDKLIENDCSFKLFNPKLEPELMPEFIVAAFRVGHSQVLERYVINDLNPAFDLFNGDNDFWGDSLDLRGGIERNCNFIDWKYFFYMNAGTFDHTKTSKAGAYDPFVVNAMSNLRFLADNRSIIRRNLERSFSVPLNHHAIAFELYNKLGMPEKLLTKDDVSSAFKKFDEEAGNRCDFEPSELPLWLYLLVEAKVLTKGQRLGPLGSQIIAEQLIWILKHDKTSILQSENGNWRPDPIFEKFDLRSKLVCPEEYRSETWNNRNDLFSIQHALNFLID